MAIPLQITYRDVPQSDVLDALIARETEKLGRYFPRIVSCRVLIEHLHHRAGAPYHLRIFVNVPGHEIVINQAGDVHESLKGEDEEPVRVQKRDEVDAPYKDPTVAVRTAFRKARRQLQDYARVIAS